MWEIFFLRVIAVARRFRRLLKQEYIYGIGYGYPVDRLRVSHRKLTPKFFKKWRNVETGKRGIGVVLVLNEES